MTGMPTWTELTAILIAIFGGWWRWQERKDERSDLADAKETAEKAVADLTLAITEKNTELRMKEETYRQELDRMERQHQREVDLLRQDAERKDERIAHLERICYQKGEPT